MHKESSRREKKAGEGNTMSNELLPHAGCKTSICSFERKQLLCPQMLNGRRSHGGRQNTVAPASCRSGCFTEKQISDQLMVLSPLHLSKAATSNQLTNTWKSSASTAATMSAGAAHQLKGVYKGPFAPKK